MGGRLYSEVYYNNINIIFGGDLHYRLNSGVFKGSMRQIKFILLAECQP